MTPPRLILAALLTVAAILLLINAPGVLLACVLVLCSIAALWLEQARQASKEHDEEQNL